MKLREITAFLERLAPLMYQESYDNSGLQIGDYSMEVSGALVTLDVTEEVIDEAIRRKLNLVIAHHPLIFGGLKSITGKNMVERIVLKAVRHDIAVYAAHTNIDSVRQGVSGKICEVIGLKNCRILDPVAGVLKKLVVFVPTDHAEKVRQALFAAGAGEIGNYDSCSYNIEGQGTFRGGEDTDPFVGERGQLHFEPETRIETIFPAHEKGRVITAMLQAHPYEEVAYDIYPLENKYPEIGLGMVGELEEPMEESQFLELLRERFNTGVIRHSALLGKQVKKVAVCGGAGSSLLRRAIDERAGMFVSGDFKYHQFFEAEKKIVVADIGHFESEQYTREIIYDLLNKNFPKFAVHLSDVNTNPIKYL
jgi:dinuclear metal center YbgI/SA1388 family protein